MAVLTVTDIAFDGVDGTLVAADVANDTFTNTGREFVKVENAGGSPITVTPQVTGVLSTGEPIEETPITVINGGPSRLIGPFSKQVYSATVTLVYSDVTNVTVGVFRLPPAQAVVVT